MYVIAQFDFCNLSTKCTYFASHIMERDPKDKVVVVTGGARGIGYEISNHFLKNGAKTIIILDTNEADGQEAVKTFNNTYGAGKAVFMECDVTKDLEAVSSEIIQQYKVDVLVNNAGILDETDLRRTLEVNCVAVVDWGVKFWEYMRKDKGGRGGTIFNVSSVYGYEHSPWIVYYKTSKHAVIGFTRSLGHSYNYRKSGVRVIAVCPGFTDTAILKANVWECHKKDFDAVVEAQILQKVETVGKAVLEIFAVADSSTIWVAKNDNPIELAPMC